MFWYKIREILHNQLAGCRCLNQTNINPKIQPEKRSQILYINIHRNCGADHHAKYIQKDGT